MEKDTFMTRLKKIPLIAWFAGPISVAFEFGMYEIAMLINSSPSVAERSVVPKLEAIDGAIPFIPAFILGYVLSYVFWMIAPVLTGVPGRRNTINFLIGVGISVVIGFAMLVLMPTHMDRAAEGVIDAANGDGFIAWVLHLIIYNDGGENGRNLMPSFHCMISVCVWASVAFRKEIRLPYRLAVLAGALIICVSTLFVKQHYFVDAIFGIALGGCSVLLAVAMDLGGLIDGKLRKKSGEDDGAV